MLIYLSLQDALAMVDFDRPIAIDTETNGFYGTIMLLQLYQSHWDTVVFVRKPCPFSLALGLKEAHVVMHNASYDITTIQVQTSSRWVPKVIDDTLLMARLKYFTKHEFSLDKVLTYLLGHDPYAALGIDKKSMQGTNWAGSLTDPQKVYAALDVEHLPALRDACADVLISQVYRLDILTLRYCLDFQNNGMPVSAARINALRQANCEELDRLAVPVNVNSWQQVRPYIGEDESDGLALSRFSLEGNERATAVLAARKLKKMNSFLDKFDSVDGYIRGKFAPLARSGRLTCKDQNLQQTPRATKGVFGFDQAEGKVLIMADFAQVELRGACAVTGEVNMYNAFCAGTDLHDLTAIETFGPDFTATHRQIAKQENFNLLYGGSAGMLQSILIKSAGLLIEERELRRMKAKWHSMWPTLTAWQQRGIADWRAGRHWTTPLGRRYVGKLMTDQLNIIVQGFAAEVAKLALHYMYDKLKAVHPSVKLCNFIHDSYVVEAIDSAEVYKEVAFIIADSMQQAWHQMAELTKFPDLPMPVDVIVGYNWGDMEKDPSKVLYKLEKTDEK